MTWRLFLFSSLFPSNMHYWPSVRSAWLDIWPNSFFCILLDFLKILYFFLVGYAKRLRRSFGRCRTSCIKAHPRSLLRTYERSTCSKSGILFTETKSRPIKKRTTPISSYLDQRSLVNKGFILWPYFRGFDSQRFVLLAVTVFIRISAQPRISAHPKGRKS